jgi:hypothetical protein
MRFRLWLLAALIPNWVLAAPELRCHFEVNAEHFEHRFAPVSDPYSVSSVNLADRFRFKAVVLGGEAQVDLINLYPVALAQPAPDALTGRVALYSPFLGKELQYSCALHEVMR